LRRPAASAWPPADEVDAPGFALADSSEVIAIERAASAASWGLRLVGGVALLWSCGPSGARTLGLGEEQQAFINGEDNRLEYFELSDPAERVAFAEFPVALMPASNVQALTSGDAAGLASWGQLDELCDDAPFRDQPSAAFCSGVLVDWDLVLTSGHCVDLVPLEDLRVAFSYYYTAPGTLALSSMDAYRVAEVLVSRRDAADADERLDFAWLRLDGAVKAPHRPVAVYTQPPGPALGDSIISIGAGGGVPIKLDAGGRVQDTRDGYGDYFVADTDTSEGSSGGGAYAADLGLVGTLARGAPDFVQTSSGCHETDQSDEPSDAREQFTFAYRSVEALCQVEPERSLCDASCVQPCQPSDASPGASGSDSGCTFAAQRSAHGSTSAWLPLVAMAACLRTLRGRSAHRFWNTNSVALSGSSV